MPRPLRCAAGLAAGLAAILGASAAQAPNAAPAERIRADVTALADDAMEGRETGTRGYQAAAAYVAQALADIGVAPGANGGWRQNVRFRFATRKPEAARFTIIRPDGGRQTLTHLEDFLVNRSYATARFNVSAPAVFVGYGVVDPMSGYDDYAGVDVAGKIVVVFSGAPARFDSERRAYYASSKVKRMTAVARGAVGVISIPTELDEKRAPWSRSIEGAASAGAAVIGPSGRPQIDAPEAEAGAAMSASGASKLFAAAQISFEDLRALEKDPENRLSPFDIGVRVEIAGASRFRTVSAPNVVAIIPGTDPALRGESVVLSAHLDHIGIKKNAEAGEDRINNGALDNAMGVAMLLEAARRFRAEPSRRTIVVLALAGEEKGLLGADYFARNPTPEAGRIVANVNLDMPIMLYPFTDVVAFGAERSSLGAAAAAAAAEAGVALAPDPIPEEGIFTRSDHFRFAEQGVPSIYLFTGFGGGGEEVFRKFLKDHYHRPSDDLTQSIDYDAAARFADLNVRIARRIADAGDAPRWTDGELFGR